MTVTIHSVQDVGFEDIVAGEKWVEAEINAPHWLLPDVVESDTYMADHCRDSLGARLWFTFRRASDGTFVEGRALKLLTKAYSIWRKEEWARRKEENRLAFVEKHAKVKE